MHYDKCRKGVSTGFLYNQAGSSEVKAVSSLLFEKQENYAACGSWSSVVVRIVSCRPKTDRQIQEVAAYKVNVE